MRGGIFGTHWQAETVANSATQKVCDSPDGTTIDVINDINNIIGHEEDIDQTGQLSHRENDTSAPEKTCTTCDKSFTSITGFNDHMKNHELKKFSCMYCLKRFPTLSILNQHIAEHDADETPKQFSCLKCDKKFTTKYNLQYHERVHTGEKPFNCALCNKSFKSPSGLTYHMENHKRSPFTCSHCDKLFESEDKLKSHQVMRNHM